MTEQSESQKVRDRALEVAGLTRAYGEFHALKNISWSVDEGTWWGIIGPNGSGKSTLLHLLSGVDQPTSGNVHIYGKRSVATAEKSFPDS